MSIVFIAFSIAGPSIPAAPRSGEVDAREQRRERRPVDLYLGFRPVELRELKTSSLETFRQNAPSRAIKPDRLCEPPAPIEE